MERSPPPSRGRRRVLRRRELPSPDDVERRSADALFRERVLARLVTRHAIYLDGQQAVIYKGLKHNPTLGRNFETMDPLEWLARMADHIPDPGRHRTLFYAYYANRVRGDRAALEPGEPTVEEQPAKKRRCSATWARLISKVFHVDPLTCTKCGGKLEIIAYLHDQVSISKILAHLGLSPPETAKPPPAVHEVVRVAVDEEGRQIEAP